MQSRFAAAHSTLAAAALSQLSFDSTLLLDKRRQNERQRHGANPAITPPRYIIQPIDPDPIGGLLKALIMQLCPSKSTKAVHRRCFPPPVSVY